jgi:hypothetical protein
LSSLVKLASFLVLLVVVFAGARYAGVRLGPVSTTYSHGQGTGGSGGSGNPGMGGMDMGQP